MDRHPSNIFRDFDNILRQFGFGDSSDGSYTFSTRFVGGGSWAPVDVYEKGDQYVMTADLPGIKKEDMEVNVTANKVCLKANRATPTYLTNPQVPPRVQQEPFKGTKVGVKSEECETSWLHYSERQFGQFNRCFQLPGKIKESSVKAHLNNGVLEVTMDKEAPTVTQRTISIE